VPPREVGRMMTIKELLIKHEGKKSRPYKCPAGFNTIGVGYNFDANPLPEDIEAYLKKNGKITDYMIDRLFDLSLHVALSGCRALFPVFDTFSHNRQIALIDLVFQLGKAGMTKFKKSIPLINAGKWEEAAKEMRKSEWAKQTKNRSIEITNMIREG